MRKIMTVKQIIEKLEAGKVVKIDNNSSMVLALQMQINIDFVQGSFSYTVIGDKLKLKVVTPFLRKAVLSAVR